jgi:hypothetical protein
METDTWLVNPQGFEQFQVGIYNMVSGSAKMMVGEQWSQLSSLWFGETDTPRGSTQPASCRALCQALRVNHVVKVVAPELLSKFPNSTGRFKPAPGDLDHPVHVGMIHEQLGTRSLDNPGDVGARVSSTKCCSHRHGQDTVANSAEACDQEAG